MIDRAQIYGQLKVRLWFTCSVCRTEELSTKSYVEYENLDKHRRTGHNMPYGWASYYPDVFKCPTCKEKIRHA